MVSHVTQPLVPCSLISKTFDCLSGKESLSRLSCGNERSWHMSLTLFHALCESGAQTIKIPQRTVSCWSDSMQFAKIPCITRKTRMHAQTQTKLAADLSKHAHLVVSFSVVFALSLSASERTSPLVDLFTLLCSIAGTDTCTCKCTSSLTCTFTATFSFQLSFSFLPLAASHPQLLPCPFSFCTEARTGTMMWARMRLRQHGHIRSFVPSDQTSLRCFDFDRNI